MINPHLVKEYYRCQLMGPGPCLNTCIDRIASRLFIGSILEMLKSDKHKDTSRFTALQWLQASTMRTHSSTLW